MIDLGRVTHGLLNVVLETDGLDFISLKNEYSFLV